VPYPAFRVVSWPGDVGNNTFEAMLLNLFRGFHNGFLLSGNYMWSLESTAAASVAVILTPHRIPSVAPAARQAAILTFVGCSTDSTVSALPLGVGKTVLGLSRHGPGSVR
jgi:hypothetical protein